MFDSNKRQGAKLLEDLISTGGGETGVKFLKELSNEDLDAVHDEVHAIMTMMPFSVMLKLVDISSPDYKMTVNQMTTIHMFIKRETKEREQGYALTEEQNAKLLSSAKNDLALMLMVPPENIVTTVHDGPLDPEERLKSFTSMDELKAAVEATGDEVVTDETTTLGGSAPVVPPPSPSPHTVDMVLTGLLHGRNKRKALPPA